MLGIETFNSQSGTGFNATVVAATATGRKVRITDVHLISTLTQTNIQLRTDSVTGTIYLQADVSPDAKSETTVVSEGILFPNGVYLVTSANFAAVTINYRTEL